MRNILCNLINPVSALRADYLPMQVISIENDTITALTSRSEFAGRITDDYSACLALPGFFDLHVHLNQYRIRGAYEPALLPWLEKHVFPEEARAKQADYAKDVEEQFFAALFQNGTTYSVIYTAPFASACEIAFEVARAQGVKALIGMTMMDMNSPQSLMQDSKHSLEDSVRLYESWHGKNPDLDYIFTPRFAPTCSFGLLQEVGRYISEHNAWLQTHLSENQAEIEWVKQLFGMRTYTEVYAKAGMLSKRSIFGHAIHLNEAELELLKYSGSAIAHCPDSNFFLKSGEFPLAAIENMGIPFALGSDVGAGTTLNMLHHARMMNYRQSSDSVLPAKALYHITLGSARLLEKDTQTGSLETGKQADLVILSPPEGYSPSELSLSQLVFFGQEFRVMETLVSGQTKYRVTK